MSYWGYNNENKKPTTNKYIYQTRREEAIETSIPDTLELIHNTHDIVILTRAFYLLGLYLLSEESGCDKIIKCKVLYDKILTVLSCGLQTKVCIALNLISALLFFSDDQGYSRRRTLHIYAQNMIKTSGCLAAMCDLFTNSMMRRVTLRALCSSLSATAGAAQAQCAHLVAQCIQRCRQDHSEIFPLLQILLSNNDRNIQLFHESNGMTIFTRESLQHPACLHLLNTLAENKSPLNKNVLNQSNIFQLLSYLLSKYGPGSMVGKWALIILHSQRRAIDTDPVKNVGYNNNETAKDDTIRITHNKYEKRRKLLQHNNNETSRLFHNIYKEIMMLQQQDRNNKTDLNGHQDILEFGKETEFGLNYKFPNNRKELIEERIIYKDKCTLPSPLITDNTNDLSFSFLKTLNTDTNINAEITKCTENINKVLRTSHLFQQTKPVNEFVKYKKSEIGNVISNQTENELESNIANNTILEFKPPFVSTPKHSNKLKTTQSSSSWSLASKSAIRRPGRLNTEVQRVYKSKHLLRKTEKRQNKSMSTKFFDLINGSCTTLVKSFTNIKNIFKRKISEEVAIEDTKGTVTGTDTSTPRSYSFTKYMTQRDAYLLNEKTILTKEITDKTNYHCSTCNDTGVLRKKIESDKSLQKTIKKLKLGVNLYGCNFKKISSTMWPRETYMTPSVLYNLYRKLIIK